MKLTRSKLITIIKEEITDILNEASAMYDADVFLSEVKQLANIVPNDVIWFVPYTARSKQKKVQDPRKAVRAIESSIRALEDEEDTSGRFRVSQVLLDKERFREEDRWSDYRSMQSDLDRAAQAQSFEFDIDKLVRYLKSNPETLEYLHSIDIELFTDTISRTADRIGRGDFGRLD